MSAKREPLLSDEQIETEASEWNEGVRGVTIAHRAAFAEGAVWCRSEHEAARAKDAELIQQLVDALDRTWDAFDLYASCRCDGSGCPVCRVMDRADNALFAANQHGFKPAEH